MTINSKTDLDMASQEVRELFIERLVAGVYSWEWKDGQWVLKANTDTLDAFGLSLSDYPDAPKPEKPDYNPDEVEAQRKAEEAQEQRKAAYQAEADPLFFKAQRGEATEQEWLDKIAEIKARFPKE